MSIKNNKKLDEESYRIEEKHIFRGSEAEKLKIIQTLVCFLNYRGGELKIYEVEHLSDFKSFFDSANIEKKINSFIEPSITGIISVKHINYKKGVSIKIEASPCSPHFYKKDGYFINRKKKKIFVFYRDSIGIRRSGENSVWNSRDVEQFFKEKLSKVFSSFQSIIVDKPINELTSIFDNLKAIEGKYINDPNNPLAIPTKQIIDTEPFISIESELNAAVKAWKTSKNFINENLIGRAYINSTKVKKQEWIKLLFLSSLKRRLPVCLWGVKLRRSELNKLAFDTAIKDLHPSCIEILKIAPLLASRKRKKILELSLNSHCITAQRLAQKILDKIDPENRLNIENIMDVLYINKNVYKFKIDEKEIKINIKDIKKDDVKEVISAFIQSSKKDKFNLKYIWKILDLVLYGKQILKD